LRAITAVKFSIVLAAASLFNATTPKLRTTTPVAKPVALSARPAFSSTAETAS
jgi:hypothetical protein